MAGVAVRGFRSEADAFGYYWAHRKQLKPPVEYAPGHWEVPDGSTEITKAPRRKEDFPVKIPMRPGNQPQVPAEKHKEE